MNFNRIWKRTAAAFLAGVMLLQPGGFAFAATVPSTTSATAPPARYVSPNGSNDSAGTQAAPWKTLQYGLNQLQPGQTLYALSGVYNEKITLPRSGTEEMPLRLMAAPGAKPVIDGSSVKGEALVEIGDKDYFRLEGFELRNNGGQAYPVGVLILGGARHVSVVGNVIHDIHTNVDPAISDNSAASAILVEGDNPAEAVTDLLIEANTVYDCTLGRGEAISVSKNVDGFVIKNNSVSRVTNIGIDAAGFHGSFSGDPLLNQARNGVIAGNTVSGARSLYETGDASGIYVDGAKNVLVENNRVFDCDYGLTVGCEVAGRSASDIIVRQNVIYQNDKSGLSIGGWSSAAGRVSNVTALNNLTYQNNRFGRSNQAELNLKLTTGGIRLFNNIFYSRQIAPVDFSKNGSAVFYPMVYNLVRDSDLQMDANLWHADVLPSQIYYRWHDQPLMGFQAFMIGSGQEARGNCQQPLFADAALGDFRPSPGSPVTDLGQKHSRLSAADLLGKPRIQGLSPDAGPYEAAGRYSSHLIDGRLDEWLKLPPASTLSPLAESQSMSLQTATDKRSLFIGMKIGSPKEKTQFYIDTDLKSTTGFSHYRLKAIGAEYLVESGTLYRYAGSGTDWKWTKVGKAPTAATPAALEAQITLSHLGLDRAANLRVGYLGKTAASGPYDEPLLSVIAVVLH